MSENQLKGDWETSKVEARKRWDKLTEEDLNEIEGQRDKLVLRLQKLYGLEWEEAEAQVLEWEGTRI